MPRKDHMPKTFPPFLVVVFKFFIPAVYLSNTVSIHAYRKLGFLQMIFYPRFDVYALRYMMFSDNFFSFYVCTLPYLKITLLWYI